MSEVISAPANQLVIRGLEKWDAEVLQAAGRGLAAGLQAAAGIAQRTYLRGPRPQKLGIVTGRLFRSITTSVDVAPTEVVGVIGTNVPYARRHELGFRGTERVRAHTRVLGAIGGGKAVDLRQRRGEIRDQSGQLVGYKRSNKTVAGQLKNATVVVQFVKAHTRQANTSARPFLSPALRDSREQILTRINREITAAAGPASRP